MRFRKEVGADFERKEGERESNRVGPSRPGDEGQHTQNGSPPRVVSRNLKTKTPNRSRLGVEWWWTFPKRNPTGIYIEVGM
ncbi:hypothetical protein GCM10009079_31220 [Ralstonia mannitolilytica]